MRRAAAYEILALWILWVLPFVPRRLRAPAARPSKTAPLSILGMVLQAAAYPVVFMTRNSGTHPPEVWRLLLSFALGAVSLALIWSALPALGKQWRLQAGVYQDHELVETGPYRFVRHPIYASMLALLLAAAGLAGTPLLPGAIAVALMIAGTEVRVHMEEGLLAEQFGQAFADYKTRVPAYIPFVR